MTYTYTLRGRVFAVTARIQCARAGFCALLISAEGGDLFEYQQATVF